jgi:hypothetical protein
MLDDSAKIRGKKRRSDPETEPRPKKKAREDLNTNLMWTCCMCGAGTHNLKTVLSCIAGSCSHTYCGNCPSEAAIALDSCRDSD